ncbi:MAG: hypothetical protein A4E64_00294 [Syntrophorhabdus sp. PtaU1.Bin058]|nr:MAG: hypothetical protein A4E64_00294 [Syntrophorhabdus sp. PtaU1.Bin058]
MKNISLVALLAIVLLVGLQPVAHSQSANPQQTLNLYLSDLQKNPNDYALRERIIKHVQTMRPAPAIPEEAERYMARGAAAVKGAKDANDFKDAVRELEKATLAAPWLANAYYNLGYAQDKAGLFADAIENLKLYLFAAPNAADAKKVKELIYEIEYRQEKKAKESSPEALAKREREKSEEFLRKLNGAVFTADLDVGCYGERHTVTIQGSEFIFRSQCYRSTCPDQVHTRVGYEDKPWSGKINIIGFGHFSLDRTWPINEFRVSEDGGKMWLYLNKRPFGSNPFYRR